MRRLIAAAATALVVTASLATPAGAWTEGPRTERELDQRIQTLQERKEKHRDAIKTFKRRIERRHDRLDALRRKVNIFRIQEGWVATLVRLRDCESGSNYRESPNEGTPGHDGAYQYDEQTWADAYGYALSYLAPWFLQDALTALKLKNGESWRWACY